MIYVRTYNCFSERDLLIEKLSNLEDESSAVKISLVQLLQEKSATNKSLALEINRLQQKVHAYMHTYVRTYYCFSHNYVCTYRHRNQGGEGAERALAPPVFLAPPQILGMKLRSASLASYTMQWFVPRTVVL